MNRSFKHAPHQQAINLPPFGGVGWFLVIQSGAPDRRHARFDTDGFPDALPTGCPEPARPDGKTRPWRRPLTFASHWLRRVMGGRLRGA